MLDLIKILHTWLLEKESEIKKDYNRLGFRASGTFEKSLAVKMRQNGGMITGAKHSYWMNNGRGRNIIQTDEAIWKWARWAAANFIKQWCVDKGISTVYAFPISYKIAKEGYILKGERDNFISKIFNENAMKQLNDLLIKDIKSDIILSLKK